MPFLLLALFLSGIAGLTYQVLWLRLLSLAFGVTAYAASTVLASFMAGLALGSFLAGRVALRARRPLLWFGCAELLIGLSALATPTALEAIGQVYGAAAGSLGDALALTTTLRFVCSLAVLIVPTTLMGATLPLVVASPLVRRDSIASRIGALYGTNTAGAICGAILDRILLDWRHRHPRDVHVGRGAERDRRPSRRSCCRASSRSAPTAEEAPTPRRPLAAGRRHARRHAPGRRDCRHRLGHWFPRHPHRRHPHRRHPHR